MPFPADDWLIYKLGTHFKLPNYYSHKCLHSGDLKFFISLQSLCVTPPRFAEQA